VVTEEIPRFAVCMAAFNGAGCVAEQLESILQQRNVLVQIFISVDLSIDGTEELLAEWALLESRLILLPFGHHFGGAGPNFYRLVRDVDLTEFDYLCFSDQDDVWDPEKLCRAHRVLTAKGAAGYSSSVTAIWPSGKKRFIDKASPQRKWDFLFESAGPGCTYVLDHRLACAFQELVRAADDQLLLIDYHDWLAYAFARVHDYRWVIDDWSSMKYRQHPNNQIGVNAGWRSFWLRARKILSGYGFQQSLLIADAIGASSLPLVRRGLRGGRLGCLWLALQAGQCRRRPVDQLWFFISCVLLAVVKPADRGSP